MKPLTDYPTPLTDEAEMMAGSLDRMAMVVLSDEAKSIERKLALAVDTLARIDCGCTLRQRESGHHVDCWMPMITEALAAIKGE